ncbi:MAG: lytic transglycosylase domain-containing protein [Terriglobales bacterium]
MLRRLQIALMASLTAISFHSMLFTPMPAWAESGERTGAITSTTDESGRKIYVNGDAGSGRSSSSDSREASAPARSPLVYWSSTEHRFKPVPTSGAVMRAARSAASEVNTYLDGKTQSHQTASRAFTQQDIDAAIDAAAARHHVDPSLVRSVVKVESNFNPNAVSRKGAMGLMQLMPATARSLNVANPFDPEQNVDAGVRHLRKLLDSYGGNVRLSLAAYNAGSGAVARSAGVPHFRETQDYVRRITRLYNGGDESDSYVIGNVAHNPFGHEPVRVQRDARGVLYISNTE